MDQTSIINPEHTEYTKPNPSDIRLHAEMLRVKAVAQLQRIQDIWRLAEEDLMEYFEKYQSMPYAKVNVEGLFAIEKVKMVRTQNKMYFGEIYQKKKQGKGIAIYRNGKIYQGEFHLNEKTGFGVEVYNNANVYVGDFSQNKKHGKGSFFWFNLTVEGQVQKEVEQYHGDWWGGLPDGQGEHLKKTGDLYVGYFKNGLKHGQGTEMYANGDKYKGEFVNGLPEGYGEYNWMDGSMYKGDFKQGTRNGYGVWRNSKDPEQVYKGHYMLDKKHGYGIYDWGNGYVYKGFWLDDLRYGEGELFFKGELEYDGFWENGEKVDQRPDMKKLKGGHETVQTTMIEANITAGTHSKVTDRFGGSQEKKPKARNISADRNRAKKEEFEISINRDHSQERSKCGHRNCIPVQEIGKMPKPAWKNAWKK